MKTYISLPEFKFYLAWLSSVLFFVTLIFYLIVFSKREIHIGSTIYNTDLANIFIISILGISVFSVFLFNKQVTRLKNFMNSKTTTELSTIADDIITGNKFIILISVFCFELILMLFGVFIFLTN